MSELERGPEPGRETICLAMIVRNEASVIESCLRAAVGHIDSWVIVDTGSDDETCDRIEEILGAVPGRLERRSWINFGYNRTELLDLARQQGADWLLLLDADMVIDADEDLHDLVSTHPDHDLVLAEVVGEDRNATVPLMVRSGHPWRFEGAAHEHLTSDLAQPRVLRRHAIRVRDLGHGRSREERLERAVELLEAEYERDPKDPRTVFYLAQTHRNLGHTATAVRYYAERAAMAGWEEATFYAQYQVGILKTENDWPGAADALLRAWSMRPTRAEPLYRLAYGWRNRGVWQAAYLFASRGIHIPEPEDTFFVEVPLYRWGLRFERSVAAWYVGEHDLARSDTEELLADPELPEHWRAFAEANLRLIEG